MENQTLDEKWGKEQIVISKNTVLRMLKAFEVEGLEGIDNLIFEDNSFICYRKIGEQTEYKIVPRLETEGAK
jgi:hypothetical protein